MKELLHNEMLELTLHLETLKDSTQPEGIIKALHTAIEERIRYIDAQINLLVLKEQGAI